MPHGHYVDLLSIERLFGDTKAQVCYDLIIPMTTKSVYSFPITNIDHYCMQCILLVKKKKMQFPYKIRLPFYMHFNNMVIILFL